MHGQVAQGKLPRATACSTSPRFVLNDSRSAFVGKVFARERSLSGPTITAAHFKMTLLPNIQWAQRKDRLYLTIDLQNAKDPPIKLDNGEDGKHGHVSFKGKAQSHATGADAHEYEVELDLFGAIDSEESKISISDRSVLLVIAKQEPSESYAVVIYAVSVASGGHAALRRSLHPSASLHVQAICAVAQGHSQISWPGQMGIHT